MDEDEKIKALPTSTVLFNLIRNPSYLFSIMAMTNMYFVVTGLQYWAT